MWLRVDMFFSLREFRELNLGAIAPKDFISLSVEFSFLNVKTKFSDMIF